MFNIEYSSFEEVMECVIRCNVCLKSYNQL